MTIDTAAAAAVASRPLNVNDTWLVSIPLWLTTVLFDLVAVVPLTTISRSTHNNNDDNDDDDDDSYNTRTKQNII